MNKKNKPTALGNLLYKSYKLILIFLLLVVISLNSGTSFFMKEKQDKKHPQKATVSFTLKDVQQIFPEATSVDNHKRKIKIYANKEKLGWAYSTSPASDSIIGFGGPVPMLIGVDQQDKVKGISLLKNSESRGFIRKIKRSGFFNQWNGIPIKEIPSHQVDAVSGATISTTAMIGSVNYATSQFLHLSSDGTKKHDWLNILKLSLGYLLILSALLQYFGFFKKMKKYRLAHQIFTIVVLGFWMGTFLSSVTFYNWATQGINLEHSLFLLILVVISLVLPLFFDKAFYCSYVCPYGACQELAGKLNKKNKVKLPLRVKNFLSNLRERIFAVIVFLLLIGVSFDLTNVEPFSAFLFQTASVPIIILALAFLILSIFIPKPWCRYMCPTGQILEIIRKPKKKK